MSMRPRYRSLNCPLIAFACYLHRYNYIPIAARDNGIRERIFAAIRKNVRRAPFIAFQTKLLEYIETKFRSTRFHGVNLCVEERRQYDIKSHSYMFVISTIIPQLGSECVNASRRNDIIEGFVMKILIYQFYQTFLAYQRLLFIFLGVQIFSYNLFSIFQSIDLYVACTILLRWLCISSRSH